MMTILTILSIQNFKYKLLSSTADRVAMVEMWTVLMLMMIMNDSDSDDEGVDEEDDNANDDDDDDLSTTVVTLPCGRHNPILWRVRDVAR